MALFMIVEKFKGGNAAAVGERFKRCGRMIPEGQGVEYVSSWMWADGAGCYQIMRAPDRGALDPWMANWADLGEFEVIEVMVSADFWAEKSPAARGAAANL
jgi:hypothetical protein